jgi:hypothetical protein
LITLIILGEEYKLWSSWLCSFLQPPVTSSLFGHSSIYMRVRIAMSVTSEGPPIHTRIFAPKSYIWT